MKIVMFKVNNGRRSNKRRVNTMGVERFLTLLLVFTFTVLIIAQTALIGPDIRTSTGETIGREGKPLGLEEYLYSEGKIGLELSGPVPDEGIKILVNGDEVADFGRNFVSITVRDGDIIEIDGSDAMVDAEVSIVTRSENISESFANKRIKVGPGVKFLTQIDIE